VSKTLGGGNMLVTCFDGETRIGHIRGKMRKKVNPIALTPMIYLYIGMD
jgi:initiation factor 1A